MAVRNFYVEANIDDRETTLGGGPRNKQGGMTAHIYQRDQGEIAEVVKIKCRERKGLLITEIFDSEDGRLIYSKTTERG